jgi:hypothetical protein
MYLPYLDFFMPQLGFKSTVTLNRAKQCSDLCVKTANGSYVADPEDFGPDPNPERKQIWIHRLPTALVNFTNCTDKPRESTYGSWGTMTSRP